jgi:predicted RNA-binding Zn ribbon-like protein
MTLANVVKGFNLNETEKTVTLAAMEERTGTDQARFPFHHGRLSLSFVGTLGDRGSQNTERLAGSRDLIAWLKAAGLPAGDSAPPAAVYRRAVRLREAIARAVQAIVDGGRPSREDVSLMNEVARRWAPQASLDFETLTLTTGARAAVQSSLGRVAADAIELLADPETRSRLRACAVDTCAAIFLTPAGRRERRWCSMARCGNRAKVSAFRSRADQTNVVASGRSKNGRKERK